MSRTVLTLLCLWLLGVAACASQRPAPEGPNWPEGTSSALECKTWGELVRAAKASGWSGESARFISGGEPDWKFRLAIDEHWMFAGTLADAGFNPAITSIRVENRLTLEDRLEGLVSTAGLELARRVHAIDYTIVGQRNYDIRALIVAANYAIKMDRLDVGSTLRAYMRICRDAWPDPDTGYNPWAALLVARLVFEPTTGGDTELPAILPYWTTIPLTHQLHELGHTRFPICLQDGLPFIVWEPGNAGVRNPEAYVDYCERWCDVRREPILPLVDPVTAAQALLARLKPPITDHSTEWKELGWYTETVEREIQSQALIALGLADAEGAAREFARFPQWADASIWSEAESSIRKQPQKWHEPSGEWVPTP